MEYNFKPIDKWPGPPTRLRKRATFSAGYGKTLIDLERELLHLNAKDVVIQADCAWEDIRMDGRIRSSAKMRGPGIIVTFMSKHGPLSYPCDTYDDWTQNLRAIALAMAALRHVDRYGVTRRGEQYRGWKQLPGGDGSGSIQAAEWASVEDAARWLAEQGTTSMSAAHVLGNPENLKLAYREAAMKAHPDAGGSDALMSKVNRAREVIEKSAAA